MKSSVWLLATVLSAVSTAAIAESRTPMQQAAPAVSQALRLSDAELDRITAGKVEKFLILSNPGNAVMLRITDDPFTLKCLNCGGPSSGGATGVMILTNPSGKTIVHCIGGC